MEFNHLSKHGAPTGDSVTGQSPQQGTSLRRGCSGTSLARIKILSELGKPYLIPSHDVDRIFNEIAVLLTGFYRVLAMTSMRPQAPPLSGCETVSGLWHRFGQ